MLRLIRLFRRLMLLMIEGGRGRERDRKGMEKGRGNKRRGRLGFSKQISLKRQSNNS